MLWGRRRLGTWGAESCLAEQEWHFQEAGITHSGSFLGKDGAWWFCQEEELSLGFVKSGAGIGVEAADLSMTTQSLLFLFQVADFAVLPKSTVVESLRESYLL